MCSHVAFTPVFFPNIGMTQKSP